MKYLGGSFKHLLFSNLPVPGKMIQFDEHIFQMGWFNHQLEYWLLNDGILMIVHAHTWVGFHPLTLHNQGPFFHCSEKKTRL